MIHIFWLSYVLQTSYKKVFFVFKFIAQFRVVESFQEVHELAIKNVFEVWISMHINFKQNHRT